MAGEFAFTVLVMVARALGFNNFGQSSGIVVGKVCPELIQVPSATSAKSHSE